MRRTARLLILAILVLVSTAGRAQTFAGCWNQGTATISFGSVSLDAGTDSVGSVSLGCQSAAPAGFLKYCVFLPEGAPIAGIAPRSMTNYNGGSLKYDLYSDPSRTSVIGPPPAGGAYPVYSGVIPIAGNWTQSVTTIPIYGRVLSRQDAPAGSYESQLANSQIFWSFNSGSPPADCKTGAAAGTFTFYFSVAAFVPNSCKIGTAADLDFGTTPTLLSSLQSTSTISVRCPAGTPWSLGLSNGNNFFASRRMRSAAGGVVSYELYKEPTYAQRWGLDSEAVTGIGAGVASPVMRTVYGRVPVQSTPAPGSFVDTVVIVLTY